MRGALGRLGFYNSNLSHNTPKMQEVTALELYMTAWTTPRVSTVRSAHLSKEVLRAILKCDSGAWCCCCWAFAWDWRCALKYCRCSSRVGMGRPTCWPWEYASFTDVGGWPDQAAGWSSAGVAGQTGCYKMVNNLEEMPLLNLG